MGLKGQRIAVIGGGITGLTAAFYLLRQRASVTLFEASAQPGGLASSFDYGDFWWDRFYHCILTSDAALLRLIEDLGLSADLRWQKTKVGFFALGRLHSVSSTQEFLRFPLLTSADKLRLGLGIAYVCTIRNPSRLESIPVSVWLTRVFGPTVYHRFWSPLLRCKLGSCCEEVSAAFMWATITRLYSTRDKDAGRQERLGYVAGGYRTVFNRLHAAIESLGGRLLLNTPVQRVERVRGCMRVIDAHAARSFDQVVATIPNARVTQMVPQLPAAFGERLNAIRYLGIVCFVLVLRRSLTPFYVTNLCDDHVPFTGLIEMTNLVDTTETAGHALVYLPKYTRPDDPLFQSPEEEIWPLFRAALHRVVPDFCDADVKKRFLFRERFVQPLPVLHYSDLAPDIRTPVPGLLLANTTQILHSTLNNNAMVEIAHRAVACVEQSVSALAASPSNPDVQVTV